MAQVQIKIFDYRNARYQGQAIQHVPEGIGSCLTEDFLYCMSIWRKGNLEGPCFAVLPSEKILYGRFANNNAENLVCYELSKECQIYCFYNAGKLDKHMAAVFPYINCVLEVYLDENDKIQRQKQHEYQANADKWNILQNVFRMEIPQYIKSPTRFLNHFFASKFKQVEEIYGTQYFFGMVGEGLGLKINLGQLLIQSMGYYDQDKVLKQIGKRCINREKKVKQEGIYDRPETLVRYQERPPALKKQYRDYFRLSIDFHNKFIYFPNLQKMQKQMLNLRTNMIQNTTNRIAQQLIQHLEQVTLEQIHDRGEQQPVNNRSRFDRATPMENVTLDQIRQQINRSISQKKPKDNVSPYKKYNPEPAELKYTSRTGTGKKTQTFNNNGYDKDRSKDQNFQNDKNPIQGYKYRNYEEGPSQFVPLKQQPKYRSIIRKLNFDDSEPKGYGQKDPQPRRYYPIEQNLRTISRNNTSKSPIKLQHKPVLKYQYVDDPVNPQKGETGQPNKLMERHYGNTSREPSLSPSRGISPGGKTRLDRLSNLYDEIQGKSKEPESDKKYPLNRGRGYQFNEGEQLDKKMGLVRAERRVQSPKRTASSPYKPEPRYPPNYPKYDYKYDVGDRYQRENRYDNSDYIRRPERDRKVNFGYFDKNR